MIMKYKPGDCFCGVTLPEKLLGSIVNSAYGYEDASGALVKFSSPKINKWDIEESPQRNSVCCTVGMPLPGQLLASFIDSAYGVATGLVKTKSAGRRTFVETNASPHIQENTEKCDKLQKSSFHEKCLSSEYYSAVPEHSHTRKEKSFKCTYCGKTCVRSSSLTRHQKTHTRDKPFKRKLCGKTCSQTLTLTKHELAHTMKNDIPFKCKLCGKAFATSSILTRHQRIHTGDKPFRCTRCGKTFSRNYSLARHGLVHTRKKPFSCAYCEKTFSVKANWAAHERIHTGEKPFKCKHCEKKFPSLKSRTRHEKLHRKGLLELQILWTAVCRTLSVDET